MNDLIINGIDHSVFDLEWAKRGGVVMLKKYLAKVTYVCNISGSVHVAQTLGRKVFNGESFANVSPRQLRMATPDECRKAGSEYIEPPARWLPVDNAPLHTDVLRLYYDGSMSAGWIYCDGEDSVGKDVRAWQPRPQLPKDE